MPTVTEMLGGGQVLLGLSYDEQRLLLAVVRLVEEKSGIVEVREECGRIPYDPGPFLRAFVLQLLYHISSVFLSLPPRAPR